MRSLALLSIVCFLSASGFAGATFAKNQKFSDFGKNDSRAALPPALLKFFNGVRAGNLNKATATFSPAIKIRIAGMRFDGIKEARRFLKRDVIGGKYKIEKVLKQNKQIVVQCLFWPAGWAKPEPAIEYRFVIKNNRVTSWYGKYR